MCRVERRSVAIVCIAIVKSDCEYQSVGDLMICYEIE